MKPNDIHNNLLDEIFKAFGLGNVGAVVLLIIRDTMTMLLITPLVVFAVAGIFSLQTLSAKIKTVFNPNAVVIITAMILMSKKETKK